MSSYHYPLPKKVSTEIILEAITLLIGILFICLGYYENTKIYLYIGFIITFAGVWMALIGLLNKRTT